MASIREIADEAVRLGLDGADAVSAFTDEELATMYNGTGPEFLPASVRARLDRRTVPFLPAVLIHDVDFSTGDGSRAGFDAANKRLLHNAILCAFGAAGWKSWRRYVLLAEAWALYRACDNGGWIAWRLAAAKRFCNKDREENLT